MIGEGRRVRKCLKLKVIHLTAVMLLVEREAELARLHVTLGLHRPDHSMCRQFMVPLLTAEVTTRSRAVILPPVGPAEAPLPGGPATLSKPSPAVPGHGVTGHTQLWTPCLCGLGEPAGVVRFRQPWACELFHEIFGANTFSSSAQAVEVSKSFS